MTDHAPLVMGVFLVIVLGVLGALVVASENKAFAASSPLSVSVAGTTVTYSCSTCSTGGSGVTSLNAIAGALHIQNNDSTLSFNTGFSHITVSLNLAHANTWTATQTFHNIAAAADEDYNVGGNTNRFYQIIGVQFLSYSSSGDSQPSVQMGQGEIQFGAGGSASPDSEINYGGVASMVFGCQSNGNECLNVFEPTLGTAVSNGQAAAGFGLAGIRGGESMTVDAIRATSFVFNTHANGGSLRPIIFEQGGTPVFTVNTTPALEINIGTILLDTNPTYFISGSTDIFGLSSTGIQNTQGFQTFSCSISGGSTSTVCNLAVTEPDTSYYAMCTGTGSGLIGDGISTAATSDTQITLSYSTAGALGGGANCLVVHH